MKVPFRQVSSRIAHKEAGREVSRRDFLRCLGIGGVGMATFTGFEASANAASSSHSAPPSVATNAVTTLTETRVHVNQVGYLPSEPKRAVVASMHPITNLTFVIVDEDMTPRTRYQGQLKEYISPDGLQYGHSHYHYHADFTLDRPGRYRLRLSDGKLSPPFSIGDDLYGRLIPLTLEFFNAQSCGTLGSDNRVNCHADDGVIIGGPRHGQALDGAGGWHDAGDYMKFVETTSYVTAMMLFACDQFPYLARRPHDGVGLPPLLEQARIGLEWLLKMHPSPEEFYFQVGDKNDHESWRLPDHDCLQYNPKWQSRQVLFGIGANLAGRTAAALALGARLLVRYDQPFAHRCLVAAQSVFELGQRYPQVMTTVPADFYPETTWADDMEWGAVALFRATGQTDYLEQALEYAHKAGAAHEQTSVYNTHALAHYSLYPYVSDVDRARLRSYLREDADLARQRAENPYSLATPYIWGTAEAAAGAALNCLLYARINEIGNEVDDNREYLAVARCNRDFILGCNPFGMSFLIGAGSHYPLFPHHQIANIKKIELTGALVGGPALATTFQNENITLATAKSSSASASIMTSDLPDQAAVYHDSPEDYVTNEPAIDYTAKMLLLAAFYQFNPLKENTTRL